MKLAFMYSLSQKLGIGEKIKHIYWSLVRFTVLLTSLAQNVCMVVHQS